MTYTIPPRDLVEKIIIKILKSEGTVDSQRKLTEEVTKHLRMFENYKISERRVRKIAIENPDIVVEIKYRTTAKEIDDMKTCPVCGADMEEIENLTLDGRRVVVGYRCTKCPYWTGKKLRLPSRYIFRLKGI